MARPREPLDARCPVIPGAHLALEERARRGHERARRALRAAGVRRSRRSNPRRRPHARPEAHELGRHQTRGRRPLARPAVGRRPPAPSGPPGRAPRARRRVDRGRCDRRRAPRGPRDPSPRLPVHPAAREVRGERAPRLPLRPPSRPLRAVRDGVRPPRARLGDPRARHRRLPRSRGRHFGTGLRGARAPRARVGRGVQRDPDDAGRVAHVGPHASERVSPAPVTTRGGAALGGGAARRPWKAQGARGWWRPRRGRRRRVARRATCPSTTRAPRRARGANPPRARAARGPPRDARCPAGPRRGALRVRGAPRDPGGDDLAARAVRACAALRYGHEGTSEELRALVSARLASDARA